MSAPASTAEEAGQSRTSVPARARAGTGSAQPGLRERVLSALSEVYDPELDEPITRLRFVTSATATDDGDVDVLLRLPTPQCAPNFAFLMGADARRAVRAVPGVRDVTIRFEDHYTGEEINLALRGDGGFTGAFPGETEDDELEGLRAIFLRKALIGRQASVCEQLLAQGVARERVTELSVADLPDGPEARRVLELRAQLGISTEPGRARVRHPGWRAGGGRPAHPLVARRAARTARPRGQRRDLP